MNNNETCIHGGVLPRQFLSNLHRSQAGWGRHRCPTCAYEQGFIAGSNNQWNSYANYCNSFNAKDTEICDYGSIVPISILQNLGENQGGTGRHKCTYCAFKEGFEAGILGKNILTSTLQFVALPQIKPNIAKPTFKAYKNIDFIKIEIENKKLGYLGELLVIELEKEFLITNGRQNLADKVEHTSITLGDGLGYDILSFDLNGNNKYIEVKTTRGDIDRPFYLTKNEIAFSQLNENNYFLYRVFDFDTKLNVGKYYQLAGNISSNVTLEPILYLAFPL